MSSSVHCDMAFMAHRPAPVFTEAAGAGGADHAGGVADSGAELAGFNGEANHAHLLVDFPPPCGYLLPGRQPQVDVFPQAAAGVPGPGPAQLAAEPAVVRVYFGGLASGAPISVLRQYIEQRDRPA